MHEAVMKEFVFPRMERAPDWEHRVIGPAEEGNINIQPIYDQEQRRLTKLPPSINRHIDEIVAEIYSSVRQFLHLRNGLSPKEIDSACKDIKIALLELFVNGARHGNLCDFSERTNVQYRIRPDRETIEVMILDTGRGYDASVQQHGKIFDIHEVANAAAWRNLDQNPSLTGGNGLLMARGYGTRIKNERKAFNHVVEWHYKFPDRVREEESKTATMGLGDTAVEMKL